VIRSPKELTFVTIERVIGKGVVTTFVVPNSNKQLDLRETTIVSLGTGALYCSIHRIRHVTHMISGIPNAFGVIPTGWKVHRDSHFTAGGGREKRVGRRIAQTVAPGTRLRTQALLK